MKDLIQVAWSSSDREQRRKGGRVIYREDGMGLRWSGKTAGMAIGPRAESGARGHTRYNMIWSRHTVTEVKEEF